MKPSYRCQRMIGNERCGNHSPQTFCFKHRNGSGVTIGSVEVAKVRSISPTPVPATHSVIPQLDGLDGLESNTAHPNKPNSLPNRAMFRGRVARVVSYHPKNEKRDGLFEIETGDGNTHLVGRDMLTFLPDTPKSDKTPVLF